MANTVSLNKTPERRAQLRPIWLHALKAGTHSGQNGVVTITAEDIQQIAASYDPAVHEAPAVLGHPATDDPAYGWVRSAEVRADGLWVNADLAPELVAMVDQRQYQNLSVSLYPPSSPVNPVPGSYYLKHLGFLGAQPPAVKGLKKVSLSEAAEAITINFSQQKESPCMDEEALAAKQASIDLAEQQLADEKAAVDAEKAKLAAREKALRKQELTTMLDKHVQAGRVLPKDKPLLLAFAEKLDADTDVIAFSEDAKKEPLLTHFDSYLSTLPASVNLSEVSAESVTTATPAINFEAAHGYSVDLAELELDRRANAIMAKNSSLTYLEAVREAQKGGA